MMKKIVMFLAGLALGLLARGAEWSNLGPEQRLGGRMVSSGYLRGKIVILDCRDYGDKTGFAEVRELQEVWSGYKTKPLVVIGSHQGAGSDKRMAAIVERLGVTYAVYRGAAPEGLSVAKGRLYLFDSTGKCRWSGPNVREAKALVGNLLFNLRMPSGPKQWKELLDYEIGNLPGQAFLRLKDLQDQKEALAAFKGLYGEDMGRYQAAYEKFKASNEVKRLAKLVELARLVKDRDPAAKDSQRLTKAVIEKNIEKYASLKESPDPAVAQEAKNAIVDLKYAQATLAK